VDCDIDSSLNERGTFEVQSTAWSKGLRVTADGTGVVSHVGAALLRMLADRVGLTGQLSDALARRGWWPTHDTPCVNLRQRPIRFVWIDEAVRRCRAGRDRRESGRSSIAR